MKSFRARAVAALLLFLLAPDAADAFMKDGCGSGECRECHTLTREEAAAVLGQMVDNVLAVSESPIGGLWAVDVEKGGQKVPIYIDYSKSFIVSGQVFEFASRRNLTGERYLALNRFDPARIPVEDAVPIGSPGAGRRVIVFTSIESPECARLHAEIVKAAAAIPDVAFYIKILAGPDAESQETARALICARSAKLLGQAFEGKPIAAAPAMCAPDAVDGIARLAESLNIRSTPVLVMPDGTIRPGFQDAEAIKGLLAAGPPGAAGGPGKGEAR